MISTSGWHVLYVKSRWEKKVYESLKEIDLEPFLPQIKTIRKWSDRKKTIIQPLLPSYVFVNIKSPLELHKALAVDGACTYVRFGKEYAKVSEKEINEIKLLIENDEFTDVETNSELYKVGDVRNITQGSLNGLKCEILKVNNTDKIIVRIDSLQQNIIATIPSYYINEVLELA